MSVECLVFTVGVIVQICSNHVWQQFAVGRFIGGLGVGALSAAVPMVSALRPLMSSLCSDLYSIKQRLPLLSSVVP
jgi:hypothetical protein